ncbi:hypothetical protein KPL70_023790 [Citrus sinensis]|nr:hypothetical protein KPL70_023790 [Citrus sinensis]
MMATFISSASSSFLILQPLKPPKHSRLSKAKTLTSTIKATSSQPKPNNANARKPTPRNRRRSSYGSSRRSALKKTFAQEQVTFTAPVSSDPHVGIIGGGMAGLACALSLDKRGVKSTVFDTGNHGLGGRMGTRMIGPQPLIFDHAAQFFTVNDSQFHELVDGWLERGLVRPWEGVIGELEVGGQFTPFPSSPPKYIGVNGMRPLADSLLAQRLELSSVWALLAAFEDPLPLGSASTFEGAFVKGVDSVSWMANNSAKLLNSQSDAPHCWTFFSTAAYGKQNKVPQENIPTATAEKVKTGMLEGVEAALGRPKGSLQKPIYSRVQLWGAALPTNTPSIPCIFDPHGRAGICGDWLLGSSVESAALSGMALANHIADYLGSDGVRPEEFAVGLHKDFQSLQGHDIGQFPGLKSMEKEQVQAYELTS